MDVIRIDKSSDDKDRDTYHKWMAETLVRLGLPENTNVFSCGAPYEFVWIDGSLYRRTLEYYDRKPESFFGLEYKNPEKDAPHVVCTCGCAEFTLRYGHYELVATCARCNNEGVIYDG